jgi:hypothetical protein
MYNEIEIFKRIEECGWNIKEMAIKLLEVESMNSQLIEQNQKLKEIKLELEEELAPEEVENDKRIK